ncbi:MAG TPA: hypothetical protein PL059_07895 [Spirochaetota bacterium]|nr:hypothetical protein [Spirochaetota bacterium]HOM09415.1 hypothetical protein [Spirochaetota bacterium]HPP49276.1 hypothetical protein [Spirochaetota bacterium]
MWHRLLRIVLHGSVAFCLTACGYQYETIRCIRTVTVPHNDSQAISVQVNFTAYVAYIHNSSDIALTNNDAISRLAKGDVEGALTLLQPAIFTGEPAVLNNYGIALILKGDFDKGYEYIYKAAVLKPHNPYFRKNYLYLHELKQ